MLPPVVKGARHTGQLLTWTDTNGAVHDLTGATITGRIRDVNNPSDSGRAITGALTVTDATNGKFTWAYSDVDVSTVGLFFVQFTATYIGGLKDISFSQTWAVRKAI